MRSTDQFAHVFLFRCSACHGALTTVCFNSESNLESADANVFRPTCDCGWEGELTGFMAVRHWVQPWESAAVPQTQARSESTQAA
jgi:hypothetical protein